MFVSSVTCSTRCLMDIDQYPQICSCGDVRISSCSRSNVTTGLREGLQAPRRGVPPEVHVQWVLHIGCWCCSTQGQGQRTRVDQPHSETDHPIYITLYTYMGCRICIPLNTYIYTHVVYVSPYIYRVTSRENVGLSELFFC